MARGGHSGTVVGSAVVIREKYYWPDLQLNIWTFVMMAAAGTILGVNASFISIQNRMGLGIPWIMPYGVAVGTLALIFIIIELIFISQRQLLPSHMLLISFILLVLFIAGVAGTAIQMFGGPNISSLCNQFTAGLSDAGPNVDTLAFLQQKSICSSWDAAFSFWVVGTVFLIWMMIMASQVNVNTYRA